MIDGNLTAIFIVGIVTLVPICAITIISINKTKLKVEQIRAEALVRAEEVKAKNQLEIEKLLYNQSRGYQNEIKKEMNFQSDDLRQVREKKDVNN